MAKKRFGIADLEKRHGPMTIGLFLNAFRKAEGLSQAEFAKKLKLSRAGLCRIENGQKLMSPGQAAKVAKALGVPDVGLIQLALQDQLRKLKRAYRVELKSA
jgi:transcriptional regulator with XRE-family HTH domain